MMKKRNLTIWVVVVVVIVAGLTVSEGQADFTLWDDEELTIDTAHDHETLTLYDYSRAEIVGPSGCVYEVNAYNNSTVDISGGWVSNTLHASGYSTVDISGGWVHQLYNSGDSTAYVSGGYVNLLCAFNSSMVDVSGGSVNGDLIAYDSSTVDMTGGYVESLCATHSSIVDVFDGSVDLLLTCSSSMVDMYGGKVDNLRVEESSNMTIYAYDFQLGSGLSMNENRVIGTGVLSGEWLNGSNFTTDILSNDPTATILIVPEPATFLLIGMGSLAMIRKRRRQMTSTVLARFRL